MTERHYLLPRILPWRLEPVPADMRRDVGYTLDMLPVYETNSKMQTTIRAHMHTYGQFSINDTLNKRVSGLWEEARAPGENPRRHREKMHKPLPVAQI